MRALNSKRGNIVLETLVVFVIIFVVAVAWMSMHYIQKELNEDVQQDDISQDAKDFNQDVTSRYPKIFDKAIPFFLILFWGMAIIASLLSDTHPAFAIFSIILLLLTLVVIVILANTFNEIFTEDLVGLASDFPMTFFIFKWYLEISIVVSLTIFLALFAKPKN